MQLSWQSCNPHRTKKTSTQANDSSNLNMTNLTNSTETGGRGVFKLKGNGKEQNLYMSGNGDISKFG